MNRLLPLCLALICAFMLVGCQTTAVGNGGGHVGYATKTAKIANVPKPGKKPSVPDWFIAKPSAADFYRIAEHIQCVPHARKVSGIPIRGNAHTWWPQAEGRYTRSKHEPHVGAVMVLSKTDRLKFGHVAVVKRVINDRLIEVEHANWGGTLAERKIVYTRMPVKDVSADNDWSRARFFNYPSRTFGSIYPVSGFVLPNINLADAGDVAR